MRVCLFKRTHNGISWMIFQSGRLMFKHIHTFLFLCLVGTWGCAYLCTCMSTVMVETRPCVSMFFVVVVVAWFENCSWSLHYLIVPWQKEQYKWSQVTWCKLFYTTFHQTFSCPVKLIIWGYKVVMTMLLWGLKQTWPDVRDHIGNLGFLFICLFIYFIFDKC